MSEKPLSKQIRSNFKSYVPVELKNTSIPEWKMSEAVFYYQELKTKIDQYLFMVTKMHTYRKFNDLFESKGKSEIIKMTTENNFETIGKILFKFLQPTLKIFDLELKKGLGQKEKNEIIKKLDTNNEEKVDSEINSTKSLGWFSKLMNWFGRLFGIKAEEVGKNEEKLNLKQDFEEQKLIAKNNKKKDQKTQQQALLKTFDSLVNVEDEFKKLIDDEIRLSIKELEEYCVKYNNFKKYASNPFEAYLDVVLFLIRLAESQPENHPVIIDRILLSFDLMAQITSKDQDGLDSAEISFDVNKDTIFNSFVNILAESKFKIDTRTIEMTPDYVGFFKQLTANFFMNYPFQSLDYFDITKFIMRYFQFYASKLDSSYSSQFSNYEYTSMIPIEKMKKMDTLNFYTLSESLKYKADTFYFINDENDIISADFYALFRFYAEMDFRFFDFDRVSGLLLDLNLVDESMESMYFETLFELLQKFMKQLNENNNFGDFPRLFDVFLDSELKTRGDGINGYYLILKAHNLYAANLDENFFETISFEKLADESHEVGQQCKDMIEKSSFSSIKTIIQVLVGESFENLMSGSFQTEPVSTYRMEKMQEESGKHGFLI